MPYHLPRALLGLLQTNEHMSRGDGVYGIHISFNLYAADEEFTCRVSSGYRTAGEVLRKNVRNQPRTGFRTDQCELVSRVIWIPPERTLARQDRARTGRHTEVGRILNVYP